MKRILVLCLVLLAAHGVCRAAAPTNTTGSLDDLIGRLRAGVVDNNYSFIDPLIQYGPAAVDVLIPLLQDKNRSVGALAARVLGRTGDPRAVEPLILALRQQETEEEANARRGGVAPMPPDQSAFLRAAAANSLGTFRDPRATMDLLAALWDRYDVANSASHALGAIKDPRSVNILIAILKDKDARLRSLAAQALGQIGDKRAVDALIALLQDPDPGVRGTALIALGRIGDPRAEPAMKARLNDRDANVARQAESALRLLSIYQQNVVSR